MVARQVSTPCAARFRWNNGNLISLSMSDKKRNQAWNWVSKDPDIAIPAHTKTEGKGTLETQQITKNPNQADHLEVSVTALMGTLEVKRVFTIYPNIAAMNCNFYLRGKVSPDWKQTSANGLNTLDFNNIESQTNLNTLTSGVPVMDKLAFSQKLTQDTKLT